MDEVLKTEEQDIKKYKLDSTVDIVEKILEFNEKYQNQEGQGIEIFTPEQFIVDYQLL